MEGGGGGGQCVRTCYDYHVYVYISGFDEQ